MAKDDEDPIEEGLTLRRYAELGVALFGKEGAERAAVSASFGVAEDRIDDIVDAWTRRMQGDPSIAIRYNDLYQQALVEAGVQRPDVPIEAYAQMVGTISSGVPVQDVAAQHGMDLQQFAMLSQYWGQQMAADPALAVKYVGLITGSGKPQG